VSFSREDRWTFNLSQIAPPSAGRFVIVARVGHWHNEGQVDYALEWHYVNLDNGHDSVERLAYGPTIRGLDLIQVKPLDTLYPIVAQIHHMNGEGTRRALWWAFWESEVQRGGMRKWLLPALRKVKAAPWDAQLAKGYRRREQARKAIEWLEGLKRE
jgi:hypothetical protein